MPPKTGEPWSEDEDRKLLTAFDAGRSLQEIATTHERTMGAVRARLLKYGRINAPIRLRVMILSDGKGRAMS
jgi:hypothetical protein